MSRYHSIYATQQKQPTRWPWYLLAMIVIMISAATGAMIARGETPRTLLERVESHQAAPTSDPSLAIVTDPTETIEATKTVTPEPTATEIAVPDGAATAKTSDAGAVRPAALGEGPADTDGAEAALIVSPEASAVAESAELADPTSPADVVETFGQRWAAGDYGGMYDLLTTTAQETITRQDFIDRYAAIQAEAGLTSVTLTVTDDPNLEARVPVTLAFASSKAGDFHDDNAIQLTKAGDNWLIEWTPSAIFSQLGDGCIDFAVESVGRGSILDRNGEKLAYDGTMSVVGIIPGMLEDETATLKSLSTLIGMTTAEIKEKYQDGEPDWFMPIKTYPNNMDQTILSGISQLEGVAVRTETARVYPLGAKAAHITGYVTRINADDLATDTTGNLVADEWIGRAGIEAGADDILSGVPGGSLAVVDCNSRMERAVIAQRRAVRPQDVILTIEKDFQLSVDTALGDVQGSAVILDPRTGAVLAMASHPSFDPNWFVTGFSDKDWAYVNDEVKRPLLNRATEAGYPTGSIFKVITMAAGMADLGYTGETEIDCPQVWSIPGTDQVWRDWTYEEGLGAQGMLTLHWGLVNSCNTVFYQIGNSLDEKDDELLPNMTKAFGLGSPTGIPYLSEIAGIVPDPKWKQEVMDDFWARGDAVNLSIGQGYLEANPLQMANAYAAIANGGRLLKPFIVEFTQSSDGSLKVVGKRKILNLLPLTDAQIADIQSALRDQTSNAYGSGSARVFGDFGWPIAGKTGTAQNQLTKDEKPHSWFAAYGPYGEKATITSIVMVENVGEGVSFAAPRTKMIYEAYLQTDLMNDPE